MIPIPPQLLTVSVQSTLENTTLCVSTSVTQTRVVTGRQSVVKQVVGGTVCTLNYQQTVSI